MAGHNKWSKIKRKKGVADNKRSQIFTKISKSITLAASKGTDPDMNFLLRLAISQAKEVNMPVDNIQKAIAKAAGDNSAANFTDALYEAKFGEVGLIISSQTDNLNRTVAEIRFILETKFGGKLVPTGSVSWQFEYLGYLVIVPSKYQEPERFGKEGEYLPINISDLEVWLLDVEGLIDVEQVALDSGEALAATFDKDKFAMAVKLVQEAGYKIVETSLEWIPKEVIELSDEKNEQLQNLLEALEDNSDITKIWHNAA